MGLDGSEVTILAEEKPRLNVYASDAMIKLLSKAY